MAVKIRLARRGRRKLALYDVVVATSTSPRDGRFIEKLGTYNPNTNPVTSNVDHDRALYWLMVGAQPTDTARNLLSHEGLMFKKHLQIGVNKGAITQEQADAKYTAWKDSKASDSEKASADIVKKKEAAYRSRIEAEAKVSAERAEKIKAKNTVAEPVVEAPANEEVVAEAPTVEVAQEVVAEAPVVEAAPEVVAEEASAVEVAPVVEAASEVVAETPVVEAAPEVVVEAPVVVAPTAEGTTEEEAKS